MGFTIIKCLTFAIISMRVINVTVTTITSGHPRPGPVTRQPWSSTGPGLWRNCEYSVSVWHQVWPREETLSCCRVPSPAQSPILTTSATWTSSWSGFPPRPFFHWISGSKPQLNQVYGNNQILIYPKVFNPYWWFLFALFVQKCKLALNKGKGEEGKVSYYRCHINTDFLISISDNNDTSVTFVNVLIVDWGKIFSEWNESCPEREEFEYFFC